jgi:hypothetical protein
MRKKTKLAKHCREEVVPAGEVGSRKIEFDRDVILHVDGAKRMKNDGRRGR